MRKLLLYSTVLLGAMIASGARAAVVLSTSPAPAYAQTPASPCIIGNSSCNNPAGFGYTTFPAPTAGGTYSSINSPSYTVGQLRDLFGNTFSVGIDVNSTTSPSATEILDNFSLVIAGFTNAGVYSGPTTLMNHNNGIGISDALLTGFDISAYDAIMVAQFWVTYHGDTAGNELFFIVGNNQSPIDPGPGPGPGPSPVPAPGALLLLGSGLLSLGAVRRRRQA